MANPIQSAQNELIACNIAILDIDPDKFFSPTPDPSLDHIDPAILNSPPGHRSPGLSKTARRFLTRLGLATEAHREGSITLFTLWTLDLLDFEERDSILVRYAIPFNICGEVDRTVRPDLCLLCQPALIHQPAFVLLVIIQERVSDNTADAEARIVAASIATFQSNNTQRVECGLDPLNAMTIPCLKMSGTRPTFYLVPVTAQLDEAVVTGQRPGHVTRVLRCVTAATDVPALVGMENVEYRRLALKHFLAFRHVAKSHWERVLEGIQVSLS